MDAFDPEAPGFDIDDLHNNPEKYGYDSSNENLEITDWSEWTTEDPIPQIDKTPLVLDSLRISNITTEGPTKEYRGGLYAKQQQRYGKTYRLEMEDVIGSLELIHAFFGGTLNGDELTLGNTYSNTRYEIEGTTFVVDRATGAREWVKIMFFEFLPDGNFNLNLEAEGEFAVFNLAGELLADDCDGEVMSIEAGVSPCPTP